MSARGLVIVNTGNGKGKTTAALGMALRASDHDIGVVVLQFIKSGAGYGEHVTAKKLGVEVVAGGAGLTRGERDAPEHKRLAAALWKTAAEKIASGDYDIVVLDEITYPLQYGWLVIGEVLDVLRIRPPHVHVVITGRNAPPELLDFADTVTEMVEVKHHLRLGIKAQPGIEF